MPTVEVMDNQTSPPTTLPSSSVSELLDALAELDVNELVALCNQRQAPEITVTVRVIPARSG